ncbi:MAG TPA: DNA methyltransferase, partial [Planctomycetota bacterium]|nr:DNA methyltransferase [Planctomycetota bacterium]
RWHGPTNEVTVWEHDQPSRNENHPTEKPVELFARAIRNSSEPGHIVCDWYLGSATTMVAAENLSRICYGIELEPKYVAVALQRMKDMGLEPRLSQ